MRREQEDQEPHEQHDAPDWLDDSAAFFYADLDPDFEFEGYDYEWLSESMAPEQHDTCTTMAAETLPCQAISLPPGPGPVAGCAALSTPHDLGGPKSPEEHAAAPPGQSQRNLAGPEPDDKARASCTRKPSKKRSGKGGAAGLDRDTRWAEQLLNPCAAAIEAGNLARAQHLLYVLGELASFSGEANHRLAAHGLFALVLSHLPAAVGQAAAASIQIPYLKCSTPAFPCVEPRRFRAALIKFHEVSPWFALPNTLANAAIAQLATRGRHQMIRVIDVGVSHGTQWPTLLDALTRVPRGSAPPSIRLTVAGAAATPPAPFSASPPGYDSSPQLLQYARSINLDLAIDQTQCLETLHPSPGEALVVCLQFRLNHATADEQAAVLGKVRSLNPELVVLAELDGGGGSSMSGEVAARLEMLWSFLESTEVAFKGSDADERRVMEVEAGTTLMTTTARRQRGAIAVDGREAWRARMAAAGFEEAQFGGEAVETAKAQLRKYDGGWELVPPSPATGAAVWLRWKRQPVSFCSLWRPA